MSGQKIREDKRSNEQVYFDALRAIARSYQTSGQLRRNAGQYGLEYAEELEMAYDNLQCTADAAIFGKRRPKR